MKNTVNDIADDMINNMSEQDRLYFSKNHKYMETRILARYIRNTYELWTTNPITHNWRNHINRTVVNGIDFSYEHPDNISSYIVKLIIERLKDETGSSV
jgi:hypothetical protein